MTEQTSSLDSIRSYDRVGARIAKIGATVNKLRLKQGLTVKTIN